MIEITINGAAYEVPSSASDTNWASKQVAFEQQLAAVVTTLTTNVNSLLAGGTWTSAEDLLDGDWASIGGDLQSAEYRITPSEDVWVRGELEGGTAGSLVMTLPVDCVPLGGEITLLCACDGGYVPVTIADGVTGATLTLGTDVGDPPTRLSLNLVYSAKAVA